MSGHRLTKEECAVMQASTDLWNKFRELPIQHVGDTDEFRNSLHSLQRIIMARPTHRALKRGGG